MPDDLVRHRSHHAGTVRVASAAAIALATETEESAAPVDVAAAVGSEEEVPRPGRPLTVITSTPEPASAGDEQVSGRVPRRGRGRGAGSPAVVSGSVAAAASLADATVADAAVADATVADAAVVDAAVALAPPPRHTPAGPWSTTVEAPMTTPTWLRASPRTTIGGATGTVTGRSAILADAGDAVSVLPRAWRRRRDPQTGHRPMTARQVLATMLVCLGLWSVIDAPALYHGAVTAPIGTRRTVSLDLLGPIRRAGAALGLDRVSRVADDIVGRHVHAPTPLALVPPFRPVTTPPTSAPGARPAPSSPAVTAAPTRALPPLRVPTAANPLRVLVVGDSIGLSFGQSLANTLDASGVARTTVDARVGTGLARPDSFDWPSQLRADIVQFHPEVVVAMFGGNDDQDVQVNGRYIGFGSPLWSALYGARVTQFAQTAAAGNARLLWSGLPVVRSGAKTARYSTVMAAVRRSISGTPGAIFVDNYPTLAGPGGQYEDSLPTASGQQVIVREPDGIHLSPAGAGRLAAKAIAAMSATWHLVL